jgi:hypothetical protein
VSESDRRRLFLFDRVGARLQNAASRSLKARRCSFSVPRSEASSGERPIAEVRKRRAPATEGAADGREKNA